MENLETLSTEELKKLVNEKRKQLSHSNILDKYTNIDDLLRSLIQEQHITNKILFALYIQEGADGSMVAKQPIGIDTSAILEELRGSNDYKTIVKNIGTVKIKGKEDVFEITATGILAEVKFQSSTSTTDNKAYSVRITSDKNLIYDGSWANYESRSYYESDLTCYEDDDNGYYILSFKNVAFLRNLKIEVYKSSAEFTNIYIKYHKKAEV